MTAATPGQLSLANGWTRWNLAHSEAVPDSEHRLPHALPHATHRAPCSPPHARHSCTTGCATTPVVNTVPRARPEPSRPQKQPRSSSDAAAPEAAAGALDDWRATCNTRLSKHIPLCGTKSAWTATWSLPVPLPRPPICEEVDCVYKLHLG